MSVTQMSFDKDWTNAEDFPTYEPTEEDVRADMQYLFDSIKSQFNNFVSNEFLASNMTFAPTSSGITSTNVQDAIEFVHTEISEVSQGAVPDGSITYAKLSQVDGEEAVGTDAIQDEAVTTDKIADGAVTSDKLGDITFDESSLADGAITEDKLADGSVTTDKIANYNVTTGKLALGAVDTNQLADEAVTYAKTTGLQKIHNLIGPITVSADSWDSSTLQAAVTVTGVSLTNVGTQKVDWTPADRATWEIARDCGVWVLRVPPANNQVTLECESVPSDDMSLYFCIWD